jgi:hypothetical protein
MYSSAEQYTTLQAQFPKGPTAPCHSWSGNGVSLTQPAKDQCDYVVDYCGNYTDGVDRSGPTAQALQTLMNKHEYAFKSIDTTKSQTTSCEFRPNDKGCKYRCHINFSVPAN